MKWSYWRYLPTLWPYLRKHKMLGSLSILLMVIASVTPLLTPLPVAFLLDSVFNDRPPPGFIESIAGTDKSSLILFVMAAQVLIALIPPAVSVADDYINTKIEQYISLDFQSELYQHCQQLSQSYYDDKSGGDFIHRINSEARAAGSLIVSIPPFIQSLITLAVMFAIAVRLDTLLVVMSMAVVPFIYGATAYYGKRIEPHLVHSRNLEGVLLNLVSESMRMLPVISSFNRQGHEFQRFRASGNEAVDARLRVTLRQTLFSLATTFVTAVGLAAVVGVGAHHVLNGKLTIGELFILMTYIRQIYGPLERIAPTMASFQQGFISLKFARELLDTVPEVKERPNARHIRTARGEVAFDAVDFAYAERTYTLRGVSFEVPAGQKVAIVGPTGAGKTTLLNLLPRFREVGAGRVLLDGTDIRDLTLESLRAQISTVQQEPLLFRTTIAENIRYGRLEAQDHEVVAAAKAANAHEFITRLPDGYDTLLGERGAKVSGGERQRIAIARAFMKNAPILILDEPTSSIDSRTEGVILDALDRLMEGRTTFMIAHRLSTVRDADQILVLQHGQIVERGVHDELMAQCGLYRQLHDMQNRMAVRREALVKAPSNGSPEPTAREGV